MFIFIEICILIFLLTMLRKQPPKKKRTQWEGNVIKAKPAKMQLLSMCGTDSPMNPFIPLARQEMTTLLFTTFSKMASPGSAKYGASGGEREW